MPVSIEHNPKHLTLTQAVAEYDRWLQVCDWPTQPNLLWWWFCTESKPSDLDSTYTTAIYADFVERKRAMYGQRLAIEISGDR